MLRTVITKVIQAAKLQTVVNLPTNVRRIVLKSKTNAPIWMSFIPGEVEALRGYYSAETIDTGSINNNPPYLFLTSTVPGTLVTIEIYTGKQNEIIPQSPITDPSPKPQHRINP